MVVSGGRYLVTTTQATSVEGVTNNSGAQRYGIPKLRLLLASPEWDLREGRDVHVDARSVRGAGEWNGELDRVGEHVGEVAFFTTEDRYTFQTSRDILLKVGSSSLSGDHAQPIQSLSAIRSRSRDIRTWTPRIHPQRAAQFSTPP
jgi:hypothetical protein